MEFFSLNASLYRNIASRVVNKLPTFLTVLHYMWLLSHAATLLGTVIYFEQKVFNKRSCAETIYYMTNFTVVLTYLIVTYRRYSLVVSTHSQDNGANINHEPQSSIPLSEVLKTENAHLLTFALLWAFTSPNIVKILPFAMYSFLNLGNYLLDDVLPEYQISAAVRPLMDYMENPLLIAAAHMDGMIFFILCKDCYNANNWYAIVLYSLVWGLRIESSEASRCSLYTCLTILDYLVYQDYNPEVLRSSWMVVENTIKVLVPLTALDKEEVTSMYNYIDQFLPSTNVEEYFPRGKIFTQDET